MKKITLLFIAVIVSYVASAQVPVDTLKVDSVSIKNETLALPGDTVKNASLNSLIGTLNILISKIDVATKVSADTLTVDSIRIKNNETLTRLVDSVKAVMAKIDGNLKSPVDTLATQADTFRLDTVPANADAILPTSVDTAKVVDLDALAEAATPEEVDKSYVTATFKSSRIINGHSIELVKPEHLEFRISHRFGSVRDGVSGFFGLDNANIRLGLEYGINDYLMVGLGRSSSAGKPVDGFIKANIIRQRHNGVPLTIGVFGSTIMDSEKSSYPNYRFDSRLSYCAQILIASKISDAISLQLSPTFVHRNLVPTALDPNDMFALGAGGRFKVSKRVSINLEYFYRFLSPSYRKIDMYHNSLSIGVDIDTGGHIFSLHFTNSQPQIEKGFITQTAFDWAKSDFTFGFNITRQFFLGKKKSLESW